MGPDDALISCLNLDPQASINLQAIRPAARLHLTCCKPPKNILNTDPPPKTPKHLQLLPHLMGPYAGMQPGKFPGASRSLLHVSHISPPPPTPPVSPGGPTCWRTAPPSPTAHCGSRTQPRVPGPAPAQVCVRAHMCECVSMLVCVYMCVRVLPFALNPAAASVQRMR